jgi:hypothetical protein
VKVSVANFSWFAKGENMSTRPTREDIELRAYEIYVESGYEDGRDVEHWLQAEEELLEGLDAQGLAEDSALQRRAAAAGRSSDR